MIRLSLLSVFGFLVTSLWLRAQTGPFPHSAEQQPGPATSVTFASGQLSINAQNSTLTEILMRVSAATGIRLDLPANLNSELLSATKLGPGPPREVLASLLRDSHLNFVIQASDSDPDQIQGVLLMAGDRNEGASSDPTSSVFASRRDSPQSVEPAAQPEPAVVANVNIAQTENPAASNAEPSLDPPPQTMVPPSTQPGQTNGPRPGALSPPAVMSPQSINQQLQSMYQQRVQMIQQDRPLVPSAAPGNHQ